MLRSNVPPDDTDVRWGADFRTWFTHMGVSPLSVPSDLVLTAVGVDGRSTNGMTRYMGHVLLEDAKRVPMRADMASASTTGTPANRQLQVSAERVASTLAAGGTVIHQVFPFEISRHSTAGGALTYRGFVVRMAPVLRLGVADTSSGDVNFSQSKPFVALLVLADNEEDELSSESRFRLLLPLIPVNTIYRKAPGDAVATGIPQYKDYDTAGHTFPDFQPEDAAVSPTTPIYCEDDISVCHNERFLYLMSSTGEFRPIVVWYDIAYGLTGDTNTLMSTRSAGWHWQRMGPVVLQPPALDGTTDGHPAVAGGFGLAKRYDWAFRYYDLYRNRWTLLSPRTSPPLLTLNDTQKLLSVNHPTLGNIMEIDLHYTAYELFGTIGTDAVGGTLHLADLLSCSNTQFSNRFTLLENRATVVPFKVQTFYPTRTDSFAYPTVYDTTTVNDISLAVGDEYSLSTEPGDMPDRVLDAMTFQGLTVVAEETTTGLQSGNTLTKQSVSTGLVTLRWSCTARTGPEIFPALNTYSTRISTNQPIQLIQIGDFGFLLGHGQALRFRRVGSGLEIVEVLSGLNLVSNRGATDVRGMLFGIFQDGCVTIEPSSGVVTPIAEVDRVIRDIWAGSLSSIQTAYDDSLNAVYVLNRETGGALIIWLKTQTVTVLEGSRYACLSTLRYRGSRRVVLVSESMRFVVPRLYLDEDSDGTKTLSGITHTQSFLPTASRAFVGTVQSVAYFPGSGTVIQVGESALHYLLCREGTGTLNPTATGADYQWYNLSCYNLTGTRVGTRYDVLLVSGTPGTNTFKIIFQGNVTSHLSIGDKISLDPVVFGLLLGPLESGPDETDGARKRHATHCSTVVPFVRGIPAAGVPLFEAGVIDYTSLRANEPQANGDAWWRSGTTALERDRRTVLPAEGTTFSVDNPALLVGYLGTNGATGHLLFPYLKCYVTEPHFELKEFWIRGRITPSESTI